jgi:P-type Ca2+ transporter type 2C
MKKEELKGLSDAKVENLLEKHGLNEIRDISKINPVKILARQIKNNFVIYLLVFASIISFFVGKFLTGYVIIGAIFLVITTGFVQEYKAERAIQALKNMMKSFSIVIRNGKEVEVDSKELVPGDLVLLRTGEKVPADCVILDEKDLFLNESILTGESKEVRKKAILNKEKYSDENWVYMGSFVVNGKCVVKVVNTGMKTKFGKIASMISSAEKELPLQKKVNKITKYMTFLGLFFSILIGFIMLLRAETIDGELVAGVLIVVIAVAVSSFPEGFPVVLITSLASGSYRMAKKNAIVNRMSIIETLGETTVICSDKTGTITKGEMTVRKIFTDNRFFELTGVGYEGHGDFISLDKKVKIEKEKTLNLLLNSSVICNSSNISRTGEDNIYKVYGNPTEAALLVMAAKARVFKEDFNFQLFEEITFSSERKMMSVLIKQKGGKFVYSKGALEILLDKCKYIQRDNGVFKLLERDKKNILEVNKNLTSDALRTLAIAYKKSDSHKKDLMEEDLIFIGIVAMEDPPREEIKEAIQLCKESGIKVKMITGDNKETAVSIARQINLENGEILSGDEIDKLSEADLVKIVKKVVLFVRVKPEHKLRIVRALKENGEIVTMTGDGVNDAPALKEAHIGVAMGKNGTDVSRSVADLTLRDDNFATIVDAIKEGRTIFTNIQKFSAYQISINLSQVSLILFAVMIGLPSPLVAIQILFMNLFSDELTAITLAFNPYSRDVMTSKPRKKSSILTAPIFSVILICGLIISFISLGVFYYLYSHGSSEQYAHTATFVLMVFFGIANAFNFRSFRKTTFGRSLLVNKTLFYVSAFVVIATLLIINTSLAKIIEVGPIKFSFLVILILISLSVIIVFDIIKLINEKRNFWSEDMEHFNFK